MRKNNHKTARNNLKCGKIMGYLNSYKIKKKSYNKKMNNQNKNFKNPINNC